ncbi:PREDICTED: putative kinase-like protein TMKL1 [Tarenaya hassleriana]|uniref:Protein kinase superfamily protein n=1 Tax=Tarenaya hassleriana TaxID=28532 RepID=T1YYD6_9ROSI|nr:PREDICTED: putative kinase-like protein TMKL1 [Tarenaya hassleriana]AGU70139.1 protein kinase superfamily protein [Tarenaya hassleriana]
MMKTHLLKLILGVSLPAFSMAIAAVVIFFICKRRGPGEPQNVDVESTHQKQKFSDGGSEPEELVTFHGGEDLTICDILDAPGEVIGKSSYGTLYKASFLRSGKVRVLRFLRPVCVLRSDAKEFNSVIETLGSLRHENLVPLLGFYAGTRGEKLMVHPFLGFGNLSEFIRSGDVESHKWSNIMSVTIGIAKALDHLHTGMQKPIVHGNLKSKNVILDPSFRPYVSDFGLHLILTLASGQEVLEASSAEGYKAPELIKMKDVTMESDVYSFGVIMLELVSGKEPVKENPTVDNDEFYLPDFMRNAVLYHRLSDLYRPQILGSGLKDVTEEHVLKYFQLAMACCSPSPSLRPSFKQMLRKLKDIGK